MIKIGIRNNLFYPLILIINSTLRQILSILMDEVIEFDESLLFEYIMFLSEFVSGLVLYIYHKILLRNKKDINKKFMGINLIIDKSGMSHPNNVFKILFLITSAGFFDFIQFSIETYYIQKLNNELSKSFQIPLRSILITSCSAFLCIFLLKFKIQKHPLFIILFCLIIETITDGFFMITSKNINTKNWAYVLSFIFINYFFSSLIDVIEKYLIEYNYINPFLILMLEGITGLLLSSIYFLIENPFKEVNNYYNNNNQTKFIILLCCLFFYFIFSGGKNIYRIITNKLYSPMAWTLTDSIFDPFIFTYYFYFSKDKISERNILFFIINLIISFIIVLCAGVYNELFVLYCCDLQINTYYEISIRASKTDVDPIDYKLDEDEDNNSLY